LSMVDTNTPSLPGTSKVEAVGSFKLATT
jgi:hypothetical protein